jgi:hypothetical protein
MNERMELILDAKDNTRPVLDKFNKNLKESSNAARDMQKNLQRGAGGLGDVGRRAGMAGIQLQQFTGQITMGTNGLVAFSQQAADLGFVLGAPMLGAIAGIASSLLLVLMPNLKETKELMEQFSDAMDVTREASEKLESGQYALAESILETAKISQMAAKIDIAIAVTKYEEAVQLAIQATRDLTKGSGYMGSRLAGDLEDASGAVQDLFVRFRQVAAIQRGTKVSPAYEREAYAFLTETVSELGLAYTEVDKLVGLFNRSIEDTATPDDLLKFSDALAGIALQLDDTALLKYSQKLSAMAVSSVESKDSIELLQQSLVDLPEAIRRSAEGQAEFIENQADLERLLSADLEREYNLRLKAKEKADKELAAIEAIVSADLQAEYDRRVAAKAKADRELEELERLVSADLEREANARIATEKKAAEERKKIQEALYESLSEHIKEMQEEEERAAKAMADRLKPVEDGLVGLISGTKSAKEAFKDMASSIIQDLIRMQVQQSITAPLAGLLANFNPFGGGLSAAQIDPNLTLGKTSALGGQVSAGQAYTVGEHGREMFIPSTNGQIVSNDKLGGGVTINQTIQVSTGVQQTVRSEIIQLLPQITEASKSAVLSAKRQGGSFAKAFGA